MINTDSLTLDIVAQYGRRGTAEQPAAHSAEDYRACPCVECPVRSSCVVECATFKRYLGSPLQTVKIRATKPRNVARTCKGCGNSFLAATTRALLCSRECATAEWRRRKRAKAEAKKNGAKQSWSGAGL